MPGNTTRYVVCYDVPDDRRRTKLAKLLDGYGDRVQYSVFEVLLERTLFDNLIEDVGVLIDRSEDRVIVYALCAACAGRRLAIGVGDDLVPPGCEEVFIV